MDHENCEVSLRLLLKFCLEQEAQERMESYPAPGKLKELHPDMRDLDQQVKEAICAERKQEKQKVHKPLRVFKRIVFVAAVLTSLFAATMMTSATVRNAVAKTMIDWTGRNVGIQFKIDGAPLSALPDGYGPHYIPERFQFKEDNAIIIPSLIDFSYTGEDEFSTLTVRASVIRNASRVCLDNEHTTFEMVTFQGVESYVGHWISLDGTEGYEMVWAKDGIEHYIFGTVTLSELFTIAENIY